MRGTAETRSSAQDELLQLARASLATDPSDTSRVAAARRVLYEGVPTMLAPNPLPIRKRPRASRVIASAVVLAVSSLAGGAVAVAFTAPQVLQLNGILGGDSPARALSQGRERIVVQLPHLSAMQLPLAPREPRAEEWVQAAIEALAAQRQAEAEAAAAAAAQAQAQAQAGGGQGSSTGGSTGGGSTGGSSSSGGGASSGGGTSAPAPYVDQLGFSASTTGSGTVSVTVNLHTTGSMSVSVSCTLGGTTQSMSGPGTVAGSASYSGSFTGLATGTYSISCTVPGQMTSNTKTITVSS